MIPLIHQMLSHCAEIRIAQCNCKAQLFHWDVNRCHCTESQCLRFRMYLCSEKFIVFFNFNSVGVRTNYYT